MNDSPIVKAVEWAMAVVGWLVVIGLVVLVSCSGAA